MASLLSPNRNTNSARDDDRKRNDRTLSERVSDLSAARKGKPAKDTAARRGGSED